MRKISTFVLLLSCVALFSACDPGLVDSNGMNQPGNSQESLTIILDGNLSSQSTTWKYGALNSVNIPDYKIDSIIFQAPLRSVQDTPAAEAILFNDIEAENVASSLLTSTIRYTIDNKRSSDLKGYLQPGNYSLRVGLRSQSSGNAVEIPYEAKLIVYYKY